MNISLINQSIFFSVAIVGLWLAFWVYFSQGEKEVKKYFLLMVLVWILGETTPYYIFKNIRLPGEIISFTPHLVIASVFIFFGFFYYFSINFLNEKNRFRGLNKFIPAISIIGFFLSAFTDLFQKSVTYTKEGLGFDVVLNLQGKFFFLGFVAIMTLFILSRFLINYLKADRGNKLKIKYFLAGLSIWIAVNLVSNVYFPLIKDTFIYSSFGNYSIIALFGFTAYAIVRTELFGIKVILTQLLVFGMGMILAALPFFMPNQALQAVTVLIFIIFCLVGYLLIKATLKEMNQKEVLAGMVQDRTKELEQSNEKLEQSKKVAEERAEELEKWYKLTIGREVRMAELKEKIKEMEQSKDK
ncbi:MAG: hypothetical protein WCX77_03010 [Candidatus Paceibacterota bacterium]|jgi:hypothetical protein